MAGETLNAFAHLVLPLDKVFYGAFMVLGIQTSVRVKGLCNSFEFNILLCFYSCGAERVDRCPKFLAELLLLRCNANIFISSF